MKLSKLLVTLTVATLTLTSCEPSEPSAVSQDKQTAANNLQRLISAQPAPEFSYSQLRQTLIEVNKAQADAVQTTSFFFNQGVADPINSCPSIGFPIASTTQLTNPDQIIYNGGNGGGNVPIPQAEQTGVYTGDSTGTYAICVDAGGKAYAFYWEGFVSTVTGPATWDSAAHQIKLTGSPTGDFSKGKTQ